MVQTPQGHDPDPNLALMRAEALAAAGQFDEAASIYHRLLNTQPAQPDILGALAQIEKRRGNRAEAESLLRKAIAAAPDRPELHNNLGNLLHASGRLAEAESSHRRAVALKPASAEAHYNLGITLEKMGRPREALAAHAAAVSCNSQYAPALTRIGALLLENGQPADAAGVLERAVTADAGFFDAQYFFGSALGRLGRYDESLTAFQRAIASAPKRIEAHTALANTLRDTGRIGEALVAYRSALEIDPRRADLHAEYARLAHELGQPDPFTTFAAARRRVGANPDLLLTEARVRLRCGDLDTAQQLLCDAAAIAPGRGDIPAFLGTVLAERKQFAAASLHFERAIALDPVSPFLRQEFGFVLLQSGDIAQARRQFESALQHDPFEQQALAGLALAFRAQGDERYRQLADFDHLVRIYHIATPPGFQDEGFLDALAVELRAAHSGMVEPVDQTLRGGTQTLGDLFSRPSPAIAALRHAIADKIGDYVRSLPQNAMHPVLARRSAKFHFAGSWSCLLRPSGFHTNHIHPAGWISSAFYADLPEAIANPETREGWFKLGESNLGLGATDIAERFVKPERGMLVLFPSYFWHGTIPFSGSDTRLTVAFDVVPG